METSYASNCVLCPDSALDPLGHHAATCKRGGDAVLRHNKLRDILVESFHQAHIHVQVEAGSGLSHDHSNSRPADILVFDWDHGKPAALDLTVVSFLVVIFKMTHQASLVPRFGNFCTGKARHKYIHAVGVANEMLRGFPGI